MKNYILNRVKSELNISANINFESELNPEQLDVVKNADGPSLVLAGAGSGKTRTLIYRVAYLLEIGASADNILLVTFTNKAANQMRDRIEMLLKSKPGSLWCGTFHHIGNRILHMYGRKIGINENFGILDQEDSNTLIKNCVKNLKIDLKDKMFPRPKVISSIISYAQNAQIAIADCVELKYPDFVVYIDQIEKIFTTYKSTKRQSNNLDYDDLLLEWLRLLNTQADVRERLSRQFNYVLVDEYQDTNRLQFRIIKILSDVHKNILVVGDDAQSIYSFRAADVNNILSFPQEFSGAKIFKLQTNYRSSPQILDLANSSIALNRHQYKKSLKSVLPQGPVPALIKLRDLRTQAAFVAQRVLELSAEGKHLDEIAVLFRAHYQAAELEMELIKRNIPYTIRGGIKFFEQAHVKDSIAFLKIAANPFDQISWIRALSLQEGIADGYSEKIYQKFAQEVKEIKGIFEKSHWAFLPGRPEKGFSKFKRIMKALLSEDVFDRPDKMLEKILENGYSDYVLANFENAQDRIDDLKELVNFAHTYKNMKQFLSDTSLGEAFRGEAIAKKGAFDNEHLILSTIHQAKGLEWDAVMIIGLNENQFPHYKSADSAVELEEERRLFYVAVTRAKNELYLIRSLTRYDYNEGIVICRPSVFIDELPENVYEEWRVNESEGSGLDMIFDEDIS